MANIVVCDDEPHITRAIEIKLRKAGHHVTCCPDGAAGLVATRDVRPDLVITDCQMPNMTGLELCAAIRDEPELSDVKTVMLTAKGYEIDEVELKRQYGVCRLLNKPFSPRDLVDVVEALVGSSMNV